jgi:hypothetical protein
VPPRIVDAQRRKFEFKPITYLSQAPPFWYVIRLSQDSISSHFEPFFLAPYARARRPTIVLQKRATGSFHFFFLF